MATYTNPTTTPPTAAVSGMEIEHHEAYPTANNIRRSAYMACFTRALHFLNNFAVLLLFGAVTVLAIQLQTLKGKVQQEDALMKDLLEQVQNQQVNQQDLNERVEKEHSLTLYQMAGTFTLLTCLLTAFHITQHLSNFNEAVVQRKIVAILWMSPIYSITSFLSLIFPQSDGYLAVIKDLYEAYVIYTFLSFLIAVLGRGNRQTAVAVLACHADHLTPPTSFLNSFYHPPPDTSAESMANAILMECQILAMQFVLVRPVTSLLHLVADLFIGDGSSDDYDDPYAFFKGPHFYISMITNVSVFFAFNGLLKFYHVIRSDLLWCRPFSKFMSIKGIVFLTFWQGLLISIIVNLNYTGGGYSTSSSAGMIATSSAPMMVPSSPTSISPAFSPMASMPSSSTLAPTSIEGATINVVPTNGGRRFLNEKESEEPSKEQDESTKEEDAKSSQERAAQIQNFLICLEMLFFSIAHWCVFPAEEWTPDYRPKQNYAKPGIGLKDFASDISYIMTTSSSARAYRRGESAREDSERSATSRRRIEMAEEAMHATTEGNESDEQDDMDGHDLL